MYLTKTPGHVSGRSRGFSLMAINAKHSRTVAVKGTETTIEPEKSARGRVVEAWALEVRSVEILLFKFIIKFITKN